jgi:hypothetical protein
MNTNVTTNYSQQGRERFEQAAYLDICEVAERLGIELTPDGRRGCRGRCPACGGRLVLTANSGRNKGYCNGACNRSLSTIDLTVLSLNCTPRAAVNWLLSDNEIQPATHRTPVERPEAPESGEWLKKTIARNGALLQSAYSHEKRLWLAGRGLSENTWKRWLLGDAGHGVALPWLDRDGAVVAVNIRRLSPEAKEQRYFWEKGIYPHDHCYGTHLVSNEQAGVIVVEGEFNCLALWQYASDRYNVVSPGSSSAKLSPAWAGWIAEHERVAIWADDLRTVDRWASAIGRNAIKIVSPVKNGVKYDANECLRRGILAAAFAKLGL